MTISHAVEELRDATTRLSEAVTELVMIAHEDRPEGSDTAAVDAFAEQVSELQGSVVEAVTELAALESPLEIADRMGLVDRAIAHASLRYWRDLRSYPPTAAMRQVARRGQPDWRAWQVSIEQSQQRCEQPLIDAGARAREVWLELAELVSIWLSHPPVNDAGEPAADTTWRNT